MFQVSFRARDDREQVALPRLLLSAIRRAVRALRPIAGRSQHKASDLVSLL
jgi:hypothetical protein